MLVKRRPVLLTSVQNMIKDIEARSHTGMRMSAFLLWLLPLISCFSIFACHDVSAWIDVPNAFICGSIFFYGCIRFRQALLLALSMFLTCTIC